MTLARVQQNLRAPQTVCFSASPKHSLHTVGCSSSKQQAVQLASPLAQAEVQHSSMLLTRRKQARATATQAATASAETAAGITAGKHAVVVGAGPAGCLTAMMLAKQGWQVDVFDKREGKESNEKALKRSYTMALYRRGIEAIQQVMPEFEPGPRSYKGLVALRKDGGKFSMERKGMLANRAWLSNLLLDVTQERYADRVRLHLGMACSAVDFASKTVTFQPANGISGEATTLQYSLLIGADGASSAVREQLLSSFPGQLELKKMSEPTTMVYKSYAGLPPHPDVERWAPDAEDAERKQGTYFFSVPANKPLPGVPFVSLSASIDATNGTYTGMVFASETFFANLHTVEDYEKVISDQWRPYIPKEWVKPLAAELADSPPSRFPIVQRMTEFTVAGTSCVLLGDAAHSVTPATGQGANSALEDVVLFGKILQKNKDNVEASIAEYNSRRRQDIQAMQAIELMYNRLFAGTKGAKGLMQTIDYGVQWATIAGYFLTKTVMTALAMFVFRTSERAQEVLPRVLYGPPLWEMYNSSSEEMPYSKALVFVRAYGLLGWLPGLAISGLVLSWGLGQASALLSNLSA